MLGYRPAQNQVCTASMPIQLFIPTYYHVMMPLIFAHYLHLKRLLKLIFAPPGNRFFNVLLANLL